MYNSDAGFVLLIGLLVACGLSVWLTVLFVGLCRDVRLIKAILRTACGLEGFRTYGGKGATPSEGQPNRGPDFLG
jgi:hypothetical protein